MDFTVTTEIDAPPAIVWDVMSEIERWPEWTPTVTSIRRLDTEAGPLRVGSRARIRQPRLPPAVWEVTDVKVGRGFTWVTRSPGVAVTARHWVDAAGSASRATLSVAFGGLLGPVIGRVMRGLNERYLRLEAAGLKRRSEEQHRASAR